MKWKVLIYALGIFVLGLVSGLVLSGKVNFESLSESAEVLTDNQNRALNTASDFLKIYSTCFTKENFDKSRVKLKNYCADEFTLDILDNQMTIDDLPDNMGNYQLKYLESSSQVSSAESGYKVLIYGVEYFDSDPYPFTVIIKLNKKMKITYFEKVSHKLN